MNNWGRVVSDNVGSRLPALDLSSCDREPIHISGAVQPHGMLLAVDADHVILHVTANCVDWLQQRPEELLGRSLDDLLTADAAAELRKCLVEAAKATSSVRELRFVLEDRGPRSFLAFAHRSGETFVVELEEPAAGGQGALGLIGRCRLVNRWLEECQGLEQLCQRMAQEVRLLTGYDRVMVYQFDKEWNGAVVAEDRLACLESYLGLHYPASDIPAPARSMFLLNSLRVIPDVGYEPVALVPPVHPRTGLPLDLTKSQLRSVSPIHLEYLRNMGVGASLTVSLVVDGRLWGLIACHHRTPRLPSLTVRETCDLLGQMLSLRLTERVQAAARIVAEQSAAVLQRLAEHLQQFNSIIPALLMDPRDLLALPNAQGAVLWHDGEAVPIGVTPPRDFVAKVQRWVADTTADAIFFTDSLPLDFPPAAAHADAASGMLALALARAPDVFIIWFRPEVIQSVVWAGDPNKVIESADEEGRLHPRRSFALWQEAVRHRSLQWTDGEIEAVRRLRTLLQDRLARAAEQLRRLLPICAWCKKVRSDQNYWQQVEEYVGQHTDIRFTHGICPECVAQETASFRQKTGAQHRTDDERLQANGSS